MTDGVVEARNSDKEVFGYDRVREIISNNNSDILEILESKLIEFNEGTQKDDISMLLVNVW